jgi:hypothetical protein
MFLLVQLLFPLPNSWLGFKYQNSEEGQWSRTTQNPATRFWCDTHVDTESRPHEREVLWVCTSYCKSMHSLYELLSYHTYACFLVSSPYVIWCVSHLAEFITVTFSAIFSDFLRSEDPRSPDLPEGTTEENDLSSTPRRPEQPIYVLN